MCCQMEAFPPGGPQGNGDDHGRKVRWLRRLNTLRCRSVVLGMGDGSMTTLTIADPDKEGMGEYLKSLPSRWLMRGKLCPTWLCKYDNVMMMLGWQCVDDVRMTISRWWQIDGVETVIYLAMSGTHRESLRDPSQALVGHSCTPYATVVFSNTLFSSH